MSRFYIIPSYRVRVIVRSIESRKHNWWDRFLDWEWSWRKS